MERLRVDTRQASGHVRTLARSRQDGAASRMLALHRGAGNRAMANTLAISRVHWWALDSKDRDTLEMQVMKGLKGIQLKDSGELAQIVVNLNDGDVLTIQSHGDADMIDWAGHTLNAGQFVSSLIAMLLLRDQPQVKFTLELLACWSAGKLEWWADEKSRWSPSESFVNRVALALNGALLRNVTVKGYVGKTMVYAGLEGQPYRETDQTLEPKGKRRSRRLSGVKIVDPSLEYSMVVESSDMKVTLGSKLKDTPGARRM